MVARPPSNTHNPSSVDAELVKDEERRRTLEKEVLALKVGIESDKNKIKWLEKERKAAHAKIDAVTSWEDVDNL